MKIALVFLAAFAVASAVALPKVRVSENLKALKNKNVVSDLITSYIEALAQSLRDDGYDPLIRENAEVGYASPAPSLFSVIARADDLLGTGISNIVINKINYNLLTSVIDFDIVLPRISISGSGGVDVIFFSNTYESTISGALSVENVILKGQVKINIGLSGISVEETGLDCSIESIYSELTSLNVVGRELSERVNTFINVNVVEALESHKEGVNELLGILIARLVELLL